MISGIAKSWKFSVQSPGIRGIHYGYHQDVTTDTSGKAVLTAIPVDSYEVTEKSVPDKTELVVNAVLHYISCPEAADEFSKETMKRQIREVIQEMLADGSLSGLAAPPATHEQEPENADDLSDMMAAFRGG